MFYYYVRGLGYYSVIYHNMLELEELRLLGEGEERGVHFENVGQKSFVKQTGLVNEVAWINTTFLGNEQKKLGVND